MKAARKPLPPQAAAATKATMGVAEEIDVVGAVAGGMAALQPRQ